MRLILGLLLGSCTLIASWATAATPEEAAPPAPADIAAQLVAETDHMNLAEFDSRRRLAANHPNELFRLYGAESAAKGDWAEALRHFSEAARHADKYSQHRISLIHWHGMGGVARDRALAYVWADLAAERMYPQFVLLRERMWLELSPAEQARALAEGPALYDRYGDAAAKRNFDRALSRAKREVTGSRTGFVNRLQVIHPDSQLGGAGGDADLTELYADWRWNPTEYWALEDAVWKTGHVDIGALEILPGDGQP